MNQRLHNLNKWVFLPEGQSLEFRNGRQRTVILEVNTPEDVWFYVLQDDDDVDGNPERLRDEEAGRPIPRRHDVSVSSADDDGRAVTFLARVRGRDRLEFAVDGAFGLLAEGGGAYIYTIDSQDVSTKIVAPVIFTRIADRKQRNPHLEMMEYQMKLNIQRRLAAMEAESERRLKALEERYAPKRNQIALPERIGKAGPGEIPRLSDERESEPGTGADRQEEAGEAAAKRGKAGKASDAGREKAEAG